MTRKWTSFAVAASLVALAAAPVWAKDDKEHRSKAEILNEKLDLSDEQQQQIDTIVQKFKPQFEALKAEQDKQIRGALTPEQQAKYDEWLAKKAERKHKD